MVPAPSCPFTWDYWTSSPSDVVELTCLLPNSVYIPLRISWDATLQDVKEDIWDRAVNFPLFGMLHEMSSYVFQFVNSLAVLEEVDDENKRIRDIKPVCGVLMIVKKSYERPGEQLLNTHISRLIGKSLNEFDNIRSSEVNDFRMRMRYLAEESLIRRAQSTRLERLRYQCPPRLADQPGTPTTLRTILTQHCFLLVTKFANLEVSFSTSVPETRTPQQHIEVILRRLANSLNMRGEDPHNYVLKVCGREEYLFGDYPLIQFLYIQEMLATDGVPQVMTVSMDKLPLTLSRDLPYYPYCLPERRRLTSEHSNTMRRKKNESSWNIHKDYSCVVQSVSKLNVDPGNGATVICQAGIFHGGRPLCETQKTKPAVMTDGTAVWDEELTFPIKVSNIPRMARICFGVYEISKTKSKKKGKEQLRTDGVTLSMWTHVADDTQGDDLVLHPLGTVVSNPIAGFRESCAALQVKFSNYDCQYPVLFPKEETVREYSENIETVSPEVMERLSREYDRLRATAEKDPMYEMHEQDKKDIWASSNILAVLGASQCVRKKKEIKQARAALIHHLQEQHCLETLCDFVSPLNPSFVCKRIKPDECRVMDSKMRPLKLKFENADPTGSDISIILKIGDDLRQDMFTLQMLRIMDRLWKNHGYDFRYNDSLQLHLDGVRGGHDREWLRRNTENNEVAFNKAVNEFTMSCAGYCVATYVLGIADRHPDNIMVKTNGQAFTILRKHGHLILSLFSMMMSTGLPELSSEKDLQYLRETLVMDLSEEKAMEHFRQKFNEAMKNGWTSFNWVIHNIDKNN
ncbi:hypothetical protein HF086_013336 [Spodoptera exigua]|uniref:Uncharacterized protein n=1 Tax=Spodoptera exigua TaxID=7107 RepID=A0A922M446_SPOEX|nr:hypothetical protein HF086_013336 [Spodoptera exigua]